MRMPRTLARFEDHSLALFAALVLSSTAAVGQASPRESGHAAASRTSSDAQALQRVDAAFGRADANGDGKLSRVEAQRLPAVAERFQEIDADNDGQLSREEFHRGVGH